MSSLNTVAELEARNAEIDARHAELDTEAGDAGMTDEQTAEWNTLGEERSANDARIGELKDELEARKATIAAAAERAENRESGASFYTRAAGAVTGDDVFDMSTMRSAYGDHAGAAAELRERALRALDDIEFAHPLAEARDGKTSVDKLVRGSNMDGASVRSSAVNERILLTASPDYQRGFVKYISGRQAACTPAEHAAMERALTIGSTGNYPVPVTLDPSLINVSDGAVNPIRQVASVTQITGNTWKGVTTGAITASRVGEQTAATDNTPTLTQPTLTVTKAHAFVPFSIENDEDWAGLQSEIAILFSNAKDVEEATAFATGSGSGANPQGVVTGATTTVTAGGTAAFAVADIYALLNALPPAFRANARFMASLNQYNRVRQFDTAGGASLWAYLADAIGANADGSAGTLVGKPAHEVSTMATALTTGSKIAVLGDFRNYKIVDRIGVDIEYIPHLFDTSTGYPTGTRGMYMHYRNTGKVLAANAFRTLVTG